MSLRLSTGLIGICLSFVAQSPGQTLEQPITKQLPLFTVDLGKFGYDVKPNSVRLPKSLEFTSDGHIALSWMTFDDSSPSPSIITATNRPNHLHVIILDAATGSKIQTQEWSSPSALAHFAVLRNGQFLTCIGNVARTFSSSFDLIEQQELQGNNACQNDSTWKARSISSKGESFLKRKGESQIAVVGADGRQCLNCTCLKTRDSAWQQRSHHGRPTDFCRQSCR